MIGEKEICTLEITKNINDKLNKLIEEHNKYVKLNYYLHKELTNEEYIQLIREIDEKMSFPPKKYRYNQLLRETYINQCKEELELIKRDQQRSIDFHLYLQQRKNELSKYPINNDMVISNLSEYIGKRVNYYYKDLVDSYFDMFVEKISKLCPRDKDYTKTITNVYRNKNSKRAMNIIYELIHKVEITLINIIMNLKNSTVVEYYKIQEMIKNLCENLILFTHTLIYNFIERKLDYIDDEEMNDSKAVKIYSEQVMSQLNNTLINELPEELTEELNERFKNKTEDFSIRWKNTFSVDFNSSCKQELEESTDVLNQNKQIIEINHQPLIAEKIELCPSPNEIYDKDSETKSIESFINHLPQEKISINDLVMMYNNYFNGNITTIGLSKIKGFRNHFDITSKKINGKKITFYMKK